MGLGEVVGKQVVGQARACDHLTVAKTKASSWTRKSEIWWCPFVSRGRRANALHESDAERCGSKLGTLNVKKANGRSMPRDALLFFSETCSTEWKPQRRPQPPQKALPTASFFALCCWCYFQLLSV